jgi:hypothetical protein
MTRVALVNHSTLAPDPTTVTIVAHVLAAHVAMDLGPAWGLPRSAVVVMPDTAPVPDSIVLFDHADQAGALGYHDVDPAGNPFARVFVRESIDDLLGVGHPADRHAWLNAVCPVTGHELDEMLIDGSAADWTLNPLTGRLHAKEACDAVQGSTYGFAGAVVPNFVTPAFFGDGTGKTDHLDHLGGVRFATEARGYQIEWAPGGSPAAVFADGWSPARPLPDAPSTVWPSDAVLRSKAHPASRTARRLAARRPQTPTAAVV